MSIRTILEPRPPLHDGERRNPRRVPPPFPLPCSSFFTPFEPLLFSFLLALELPEVALDVCEGFESPQPPLTRSFSASGEET
jgi:hypothetical protein